MFVVSDTGSVSFDGRDGSGVYRQTSDSREIDDNQWHLVTGQRQGSIWKIYVDGVLESQTDVGYLGNINAPLHKFIVGAQSSNHLYPYTGDIDEVKIFPYALSSAEVKAQYNFGNALKLGAPVGASHDSPATSDGLVGHWKMDEASWNGTAGEVIDASGNGNHGVRSGNATTAGGKYGNGGTFDGTGDYVTVADVASVQAGTTFTSSAWVKLSGLGSDRRIIDKTNNGTGYALVSNSGTPQFITGNGSTYDTLNGTSTFATGAWYHVVGTISNGKKKIFVNGVMEAEANVTFSGAGVATSLKLGDRNGTSQGITGQLDDVRIYNRALDATEIRNLYLLGPGPVAHWDFDENSGTVAKDTSGSGNNGVLTNGPTWVPGAKGSGLKFDGGDDYSVVSDNASLNSTGPFTVGAWIKPNLGGMSYGGIVSKMDKNATGDEDGWTLRVDHTDNLEFFTRNNSTINEHNYNISSYDNKWLYVVGKYDGTNNILYVDGKQVSSVVNDYEPSPNPLYIGQYTWGTVGDNDGGPYYFNGLIDDVKIYNYALTPYQIAKEFNGGAPVAHYAFDEGDGQTIHNTGGINQTRLNDHSTSLDGYLGSSATTTTADPSWITDETACKRGKCLSFDGVDDYAYIGQVLATDKTKPFTMSGWAKPTSGGMGTWRTIVGTNTSFAEIALSSANVFAFGQNGGGGWWASGETVVADTWYHVVGIYDGTNASLYVNGKLISGPTARTFTSNHGVSVLGRYQTGGGEWMNGTIDDVKIFNYALSPEDVAREYNQGAAVRFSQ